jgi:CHAT domain-containing protein
LIVIPDGALHYIPFGLLLTTANRSTRHLIDDHVILTAPSLASVGWPADSDVPPARVLIVSDPVYEEGDARLVDRGSRPKPGLAADATQTQVSLRFRSPSIQGGFERLPETAREASSISRLFRPTDVDALAGFDASRESLLKRDMAQYRIVHIAAHGVTDTEAPQLSALILSLRDPQGRAVPGEVFAGELLSRRFNADLVVLSACDTALGREVAGEGLLGLRYAVHAAGGRSVIASFWHVPDRIAADLMATFYQRYVGANQAPAAALAQAMREAQQRFKDPALWGAFDISAIGKNALSSNNLSQHDKQGERP